MNPTVSIIVPCYNQAQYLPDALQSVLDQTYAHWECIIINDGSPDKTEVVAQEWCRRDKRFKYVKKENGGLSSARNAGIKSSTGEFILPLDADDKIASEYLAQGVKILESLPGIKLVYGKVEFFGSMEGEWKLPGFSLENLALSNMIYCSAIFRRQDFDKYGPYDELFIDGLEDWDLWISILKNGGDVVKLPDVLFYYRRKREGSMVDLMQDDYRLNQYLEMMYSKHQKLYVSLFGNPISAYATNHVMKGQLQDVQDSLARLKRSRMYKVSNYLNQKLGWLKKK